MLSFCCTLLVAVITTVPTIAAAGKPGYKASAHDTACSQARAHGPWLVLCRFFFLENCFDYQLGDARVVTSNVTGANTLEQCRHLPYTAGNSTRWLMVCGYGWDCREATVACREILNINNPSEVVLIDCSLTVYIYSAYRSNTEHFLLLWSQQ